MSSPISARLTALFLFLVGILSAQVNGTVINATTGRPASGVALTLLQFEQGMAPVEEVFSASDGSFRFEKSLTGAAGQRIPGGVRAEFEGVSYSHMLPPNTPTQDLHISVYSVDEKVPAPRERIMIFEPGGEEMIVNETFLFLNQEQPPKTFRDPVRGALRFYLPPEARGIVQVSTLGPAGMPLRSTAVKTNEEDVFMVDFPVKPGENRVDLTYLLPHADGGPFAVRALYPGLRTRVAAPPGVTIDAEGLESRGQEPHTQATVYELPAASEVVLAVSGQGSLRPPSGAPGGEASGGGGGSLRIAPAPIHKEMVWIIVLTCAILAVGFYGLLTARSSGSPVTSEQQEPSSRPARAVSRSGKTAPALRKS
jgi:hypothetical protein